jgi:hypothetical protein
VNSLPMGRLNIVLHVKGQHDPAVGGEPRVSVLDLLRGHAFDKPLPLPKGTPIDLTLDTSLNLDELLNSYFGGFRESAGSARIPNWERSDLRSWSEVMPVVLLTVSNFAVFGCTPTVRVEVAPINIYARLDADVRVRLDQEVQNLIQQNPNLF